MRERDLFEPVKEFLINRVGCETVYGEVGNCDVLALKGRIDIVVELKTSLSFKLLDQAMDRLHIGHYVYVAIPERKTQIPRSVEWFLKENKIGLLMVRKNKNIADVVIPAKYNRLRTNHSIRKSIQSYHSSQVGGVPSGEGKTQYSIMLDGVKRYMRRRDWVTVDDILNHCETHYAQPKPSLVSTLKADWNKNWCEIKVEDGERYFRYKVDE